MGGPAPAKPRGRLGGREEVGLSGGEGGEGDPEGHAVRAPHTLSLITLGGGPSEAAGPDDVETRGGRGARAQLPRLRSARPPCPVYTTHF